MALKQGSIIIPRDQLNRELRSNELFNIQTSGKISGVNASFSAFTIENLRPLVVNWLTTFKETGSPDDSQLVLLTVPLVELQQTAFYS